MEELVIEDFLIPIGLSPISWSRMWTVWEELEEINFCITLQAQCFCVEKEDTHCVRFSLEQQPCGKKPEKATFLSL